MMEVEVKVIGMLGGTFVSVAKKVSVKPGSRPSDAIKALYKNGDIDKQVYKQIKSLRPPVYLVVNEDKVEGKPDSVTLNDGDTLAVMQQVAGG